MKSEIENERRETAYQQSIRNLKRSMEIAKEVRYNRKYKDTLFTALFKNKRYAKYLYESLFPDAGQISEDDITFLNLENIFTVDIYNDACILVNNRLIVLTPI